MVNQILLMLFLTPNSSAIVHLGHAINAELTDRRHFAQTLNFR